MALNNTPTMDSCPQHRQNEPTQLYRYYDSTGELLYVGISLRAFIRAAQHRASAGWWQSVSQMTVETYKNRSDALQAETYAIRHENPKHNIAKRDCVAPKRRPRPVPASVLKRAEAERDAAAAHLEDVKKECARWRAEAAEWRAESLVGYELDRDRAQEALNLVRAEIEVLREQTARLHADWTAAKNVHEQQRVMMEHSLWQWEARRRLARQAAAPAAAPRESSRRPHFFVRWLRNVFALATRAA